MSLIPYMSLNPFVYEYFNTALDVATNRIEHFHVRWNSALINGNFTTASKVCFRLSSLVPRVLNIPSLSGCNIPLPGNYLIIKMTNRTFFVLLLLILYILRNNDDCVSSWSLTHALILDVPPNP